MGVHSGRSALVNGQSTMRQWSINDQHTPAEAVGSNTAFGKARRTGVRDWNGSVGFFGNVPLAMPGDQISFQGYTAPENDAYGAGVTYSGLALISQLLVNWNFTGGELINAQVDFAGHLALTVAQTAPPLDSSVPILEEIASAKIQYSTAGGSFTDWTDWCGIATAAWTLTCSLQEYVNSCTMAGGFLWKGRKPGIIDWTLSVNEQENLRTKFTPGDQIALRLYVDATHFWLLKYGIVKDFTGIQMNRETGAIIAQTVNVDMDGVKRTDGSLGTITKPDTTIWWPTTQS